MKDYSTYIFDLDGTLLDTINDLARGVNHAMCEYGMPLHSVDDVRRFVGNGVRKLMERAVPGGEDNPDFAAAYASFRKYYMEHSYDTTNPYPGIIELLVELKARGKNIAVVSNKFYEATQELCRHFFSGYVDVAIGERDNIRKKPAPDSVIEALRQLGVTADNAVYIGDSEVDVATARNCGIPCISVLWGFRDKDFLAVNGADMFVETPAEILG
ncbi:HAD family hydrolase [Xylanibacter muris]|uniref:phosphoglycolate phosphatase n=1 Tax=Xylanibacter muris TaxID=2736290 RepID=A0ABX2APD2_9BACT|nr:HAD-IIIA family hydrolase [Xylanibacter muris]NPD93106.1 HAD-IIIA family hydrolase [Xylanibacter muris]